MSATGESGVLEVAEPTTAAAAERQKARQRDFVVQIERAARTAAAEAADAAAPRDPWDRAAVLSQVGLFVLAVLACIYFMGAVLVPILVAWVVATILDPVTDWLEAHGANRGIAVALVVLGLVLLAAVMLVLLSLPIAYWLDRANELGALLRAKMREMNRPMEIFKQFGDIFAQATGASKGATVSIEQGSGMITSILGIVTPALNQLFLFSLALVFLLIYQTKMRNALVLFMPDRDTRLLVLRILSDVDRNMKIYFGTLTIVNVFLGLATAAIAYLAGLPNPLLWGVLAATLNYLPYVGMIVVTVTLLVVGVLSLPTLTAALIAPGLYVIVNTLESELITPLLIGQRLTLNPFAVFLSIAFWSWMWGPSGVFLAVPLLIAAMVAARHLYDDTIDLPQ